MTHPTIAQHDLSQRPQHRHAGKVAVVTGGTRGIGAGIVRRLAAEGARVTFTYASAKDEANALTAAISPTTRSTACGEHPRHARHRFAAPHLRSGGRIITIGSVSSHHFANDVTSLYGMTKGTIASLVRGMSRELGPRGITINRVQPGPVETPANPASGPAGDSLRAAIPIGRFGTAAEVAALVSHLAGEEGAYINGASLDIDGGYSA